MNYRNVNYIHQTDDGWNPIELADEAKEKPWTTKTRHEWDLAVDSAGNVFAVYLVPTVEWRLRVRSGGPPGWERCITFTERRGEFGTIGSQYGIDSLPRRILLAVKRLVGRVGASSLRRQMQIANLRRCAPLCALRLTARRVTALTGSEELREKVRLSGEQSIESLTETGETGRFLGQQ